MIADNNFTMSDLEKLRLFGTVNAEYKKKQFVISLKFTTGDKVSVRARDFERGLQVLARFVEGNNSSTRLAEVI